MADNYKDLVEGTYVEPGHDVAPELQPVAWQIRTKKTRGNWTFWLGDSRPDVDTDFYEVRALYTYADMRK
jgi:hypothetical protein